MPGTSAASSAFASGTTTRPTPARASASTSARVPLTGRTRPSRPSSPSTPSSSRTPAGSRSSAPVSAIATRELQTGSGLANVGWCEVDGDALHRPLELRGEERGADVFRRFAPGRVGEADDRVARQPARHVDLDRDHLTVDTTQRCAANEREHAGSLPNRSTSRIFRKAMTAALDGGITVASRCDNYRARMADDPTPDLVTRDLVSGFVGTLAVRSEHTKRAYAHDVAEFAAWCDRGGCPNPSDLDHRTLRRYLAFLQSRGFARTHHRGGRPRPCARTSAICVATMCSPVTSRSSCARRRVARRCRVPPCGGCGVAPPGRHRANCRATDHGHPRPRRAELDRPSPPRSRGAGTAVRRRAPCERVLRARSRRRRPAPPHRHRARERIENPPPAVGRSSVRCRVGLPP